MKNDIRMHIDDFDSSVGEMCAFLKKQLGETLYDQLINQWQELTPRAAEWAWKQTLFYKPDDNVMTLELYAKGLQYGITTAWELFLLIERDINDELPADPGYETYSMSEITELAQSHLML